jgi:DNA repair protein RecO (recombination protein O)
MGIVGSPGIILKRRNFGEADRILTIFTQRLGKIVVKGKAVRRPLSKLAGHLELFTQVNLTLAEGKTWYTVTEANTVNSFVNLRQDINSVSQAYYICELVDHLTKEHEPIPKVYSLLAQAFNLLNNQKIDLLIPAFSWSLIGLVGYQPNLYNCVECGHKIKPEELYFSPSRGGILDKEHKNEDSASFLINSETVKLLRMILVNIDFLPKININSQVKKEFIKVVDTFSQHIFDKKMKSLKFLKDIN